MAEYVYRIVHQTLTTGGDEVESAQVMRRWQFEEVRYMLGLQKSRKATARIFVAAIASVAPLMAFGVSSAHAATARNGVCESGEFCLYYLYPDSGFGVQSVSDFNTSIQNYGSSQPSCYDFKGPGAGQGQCVKNNARSAQNLSSRTVRVYYNSYYGGVSQDIAPGQFVTLNSNVYANNASHQFL